MLLHEGWELAHTPAGACADPAAAASAGLEWRPAPVPGTVAAVFDDAGDVDAHDWWYRLRFEAAPAGEGEEAMLAFDGIATIAEAYLNGGRVLHSESMFAAHELAVGELLADGPNELAVCCRALEPRLRARRRPRARWRTRLVPDGGLRFYRTMLIGRAPGFAPGPAVAGLWRPVALARRRGLVLERPRLRARVVAGDGVLDCAARVRAISGATVPDQLEVSVTRDGVTIEGLLAVEPATGAAAGTVRVPAAELWWPHTHGTPALYDVTITASDGEVLHRARVGFRTLASAADLEADGPALSINGVPVFARGAIWTPADQRAPHAPRAETERLLTTVASAGMNMLRIPGIGAYESPGFHDLCDELGLLVWQDFMFANLDYPEGDRDFMCEVEREARATLDALGHRPSLAVLCGGSEVAQQVAMLGLDPALASGPLYGELLPRVVREAQVDAPYVPSAPWGGELPFRPNRGVANYYGVGAYLRPLEDARRSEVRFAAECLAFANVPDEGALQALHASGGLAVHHPAWKAGVPRDAGAGWDFEDVRDHYLRVLFGADPVSLRSVDPERYLELSRAVSGEVMAEVFGEWRRAGSPCAGALVLWCKDLRPGAGWGLLDHRGQPKVALHHLRRALAPVAVWTTDEGLSGIDIHVANDRGTALDARLRVALYRDCEQLVEETSVQLALAPHGTATHNLEALLGRFVDVSWAYRFGPPGQDLVAVTLEDSNGTVLSQSFRFPAGRPLARRSPAELGIEASLLTASEGPAAVRVAATRFAYGVRIELPGWVAADDAFGIEPGRERLVAVSPVDPDAATPEHAAGALTALNLAGHLRIAGG
ncbi:MAG: glycoside hydrolase family 2 protein [Solirubrobacteraceae bacterium]